MDSSRKLLTMVAAIGVPVAVGLVVWTVFKNNQLYTNNTAGMLPTLRIGDVVVVAEYVNKDPLDGDIVAFRPPAVALLPGQSMTTFIKRIVGVPGDLVEWKDKKLYRNGRAIDEPYAAYSREPYNEMSPKSEWPQIQVADFKLVHEGDRTFPLQYTASCVNGFPLIGSEGDARLTDCAAEFVPKDLVQAKNWLASSAVEVPRGHYLVFGDNRNGSFDSRAWGLLPRTNIVGKCKSIQNPVNRRRGL